MSIWSVERHPNEPSEYYGSGYQLAENFIKAYYSGKPLADILILHGPPGVGKSSLMKLLIHKHKLLQFYSNSSDTRNIEYMTQVVKQLVTGNEYKIVVLDEVENLPKSSVRVLTKHRKQFKHPLVLICNDYYRLAQPLKYGVWEISFAQPTKKDLEFFLDKFLARFTLKIDNNIRQQLVQNSVSYRGIVNNVQIYTEVGLLLQEPKGFHTIFDRVYAANKGIETNLTVDELFNWVAANTKQQGIITEANYLLMCSRSKTSVRESVKRLLQFCSLPERLKFFYTKPSGDKEEQIKSKKKKKEKRVVRKEPAKSSSLSDWV